jgi:hypothetical protein
MLAYSLPSIFITKGGGGGGGGGGGPAWVGWTRFMCELWPKNNFTHVLWQLATTVECQGSIILLYIFIRENAKIENESIENLFNTILYRRKVFYLPYCFTNKNIGS